MGRAGEEWNMIRKEEAASPMKRIMKLVWKNWYLYIPSVLATMAYLILDMVMGKLTGETLDAATQVDGAFWNRAAWMIAAPFLAAPFHTISMLTKFRMADKVVMELRVAVGRKAVRLSIPALEEQRSGDIMAHLGSELGTVYGFVGYGLSMITTLFTAVFGTVLFMSLIDGRMTVLFVASSFLVLPVSLWISRPFKDMEESLRMGNGLAQQAANEGLQAAAVVKSFQLEGFVGRRFREALGKALAVDLRMQKTTAAMNGTGVLLGYLPMMAMLAFGALRVSEGTLTVGMLLSLTVVSKHFVTWLTQVPDVFGYIQKCSGACTRLFRYLDLPEESGGTQTEPVAEAPFVEFENVSFSYPESPELIKDLNFSVRRGETVALVGASGGGKSTILQMICGFLIPAEGQVRVRGHGVCEWALGPLREQLAYVTQDSYLFPGSIRENLLAADNTASMERLRETCARAGILGFVEERGWDAAAGERGVALSGGEKQRISIARAMLKDAPLLLLDEPTSALDAEAERVVQESLEQLMEGKTVLVVAHRLATIRHADRILVLDGGRIVSAGTHEELLRASGLYREMVERQLYGGLGE
ncbi:MAG: ABC transporter ATP-binding protein [Lachnospiraceae bacterium]|nr:ABC transporter ATP-binding protein [uncultured Acetatifactor sp.]MCI8543920.1 ABC transporter ATP-binding protein [Lachnospiraceae bacterium]